MGERKGTEGARLKRRGKRESSRIMGVYRFLFSVAVETFKGRLSPFLYMSEAGRKGNHTWATRRDRLSSCSAELRSRDLADGQSYGALGPNGHDVCLFRSGCHNTPTTNRSGVLTSVMYFSRMQEAILSERQSV